MSSPSRQEDLEHMEAAIGAAAEVLLRHAGSKDMDVRYKGRNQPVTDADHEADDVLRRMLQRPGEGWLSEETADDKTRLSCRRVWIVDPLDGTQEFVDGLPEWCISVGLVEDGVPVAGGICNPAIGDHVLGSLETGVTCNGAPVAPRSFENPQEILVLASRSEVRRGEWERFVRAGVNVQPMGSVAYKLALVAAGRADATWTLVPKSEWDVAAGVALVRAAGGEVFLPGGGDRKFNQEGIRLTGLVAASGAAAATVRSLLSGSPS